MKISVIAFAAILACGHAAQVSDWTDNVQEMFTESMDWLDTYYDPNMGYLYDLDRENSLRHNSRSSVWYALGLLARNEDSDSKEADKIIKALIGGQFTDSEKQWYGTYQKYPEEPEVGSEHYPATAYGTWDPNWRSFVATTFIVMLEEYSDRISDETQDLIMESLKHATLGDIARKELSAEYSNPVRA